MGRKRKSELQPCPIYGFNEKFEQAIFDSGLSKAEISRRANINRASLDHYIYGNTPRLDRIAKVAPILNISVDYLLGLSDRKELR